MLDQGTVLTVTKPVEFTGSNGRRVCMNIGDSLCVTANAQTHSSILRAGQAMFARRSRATIGQGWIVPVDALLSFAELV